MVSVIGVAEEGDEGIGYERERGNEKKKKKKRYGEGESHGIDNVFLFWNFFLPHPGR